jgi:hypothetical protein
MSGVRAWTDVRSDPDEIHRFASTLIGTVQQAVAEIELDADEIERLNRAAQAR